jgi:osmotically-inducible protein OsmY
MEAPFDLKRRIDIFLMQKGIVAGPRLTIDVTEETVTFHGTVDSFYKRQLCLACQHIPGVHRVVDDLKVSEN